MRQIVSAFVLLGIATAAHAQSQEKFSLSMFHFNVQYVAGGLKGFPTGDTNVDLFDMDAEQVEDAIIVESFEPILDIFLKHPTWSVTLEMQGYMVEVMRLRHPNVLAKMKQLIDSNQVELVSIHYSDQLFLAYPALDMQRSQQLMDQEWALSGVTPSDVVFCQEGQFGLGLVEFAKAHGRRTVILPKNLFKYQHFGSFDASAPLYSYRGTDVVIGARGFETPDVHLDWNFFDDGELLATNDLNPYIGKQFVKHQPSLDAYEQRLLDLEAQGFRIAKVSDYVNWAKLARLPQPELPPVLDGTWQPRSTNSMFRWMGASGAVDSVLQVERDNEIITRNVQVGQRLRAAEVLAKYAAGQGWIDAGSLDLALLECWRPLLLAEVTDASGINPWIGEVNYSLEHNARAATCTDEIISSLAANSSKTFIRIDTASGDVQLTNQRVERQWQRATQSPLPNQGQVAYTTQDRPVSVTWDQAVDDPNLYRVTVDFEPSKQGFREIQVDFPLALAGAYVTPGLVDDEVTFHPFSAFDLEEGRITIPVGNGLIGIADDLWLIKVVSSVHVGATFEPGSGRVRFRDETTDWKEPVQWRFLVFRGDREQALSLARKTNVAPVVWLGEAPTGPIPDDGCAFASTDNGINLSLIVLLLAVWRRRRASKVPTAAQSEANRDAFGQ